MLARQHGVVVNIASVAGKLGDPSLAHYTASKFGVVGLTQSLAREWGPDGVHVNAVCPGTVATTMLAELADGWGTTIQAMAEDQVLKHPQDAREIGAAVVFLASMPSITGQAINVDGGTVFW